jgi:zinc transporter
MEPVMTELDDQIDVIEQTILENPDPSERDDIINIRKRAIIFRRYIAPQKDVMTHLRISEQPWIDSSHKRHLQESLDRVTRYVEDLDAIRERSQIIKDELTNALSDRLNKNLYILSVISAIFLPLGFFTGLMGINIGGMPGVDNSNAFWIFTGILGVIVALQISIFKKLKWF